MKLDPKKLKQARINAGLSQETAAEILSIDRTALSRYENGRVKNPSIKRKHDFCTAYSCDIKDLMS